MMVRPLRSPPIDTATAPGLAARLRAGTQDLHHAAERSGVMLALLQGRLARPAYLALLHNMRALYQALEQGLAMHPHTADLPWPALRRSEALARDLQVLGRAPHPSAPPAEAVGAELAPATRRYVQRLEALGQPGAPGTSAGRLLLAHAYVRYLGDLHGGQLLRRRVAQGLGLAAEPGAMMVGIGLDFYDFGPPDRVAALIRQFRAALDAVPLQPGEAENLVAEARLAFELHVALFRQLPH